MTLMSRENVCTTFSRTEYEQIEALVRCLEKADSTNQKNIRGKFRGIGLYWCEVALGLPYTVNSLHELVSNGVIKIIGGSIGASKQVEPPGENRDGYMMNAVVLNYQSKVSN